MLLGDDVEEDDDYISLNRDIINSDAGQEVSLSDQTQNNLDTEGIEHLFDS